MGPINGWLVRASDRIVPSSSDDTLRLIKPPSFYLARRASDELGPATVWSGGTIFGMVVTGILTAAGRAISASAGQAGFLIGLVLLWSAFTGLCIHAVRYLIAEYGGRAVESDNLRRLGQPFIESGSSRPSRYADDASTSAGADAMYGLGSPVPTGHRILPGAAHSVTKTLNKNSVSTWCMSESKPCQTVQPQQCPLRSSPSASSASGGLRERRLALGRLYEEMLTNLLLRILLFVGMFLLLAFFALFGYLLYSVRPPTAVEITAYVSIPLVETIGIAATYFATKKDSWFWPRIVLIVVWAAVVTNVALGAIGLYGF